MMIPNFSKTQLVTKEGHMTEEWQQIFMQLFTELQKNASNEGIVMPHQESTDITRLESEKSIGAIVYDKTTGGFKACIKKIVGGIITGEFKEIHLL